MVYPQYIEYKLKYHEAQSRYDEILGEWEEIFQRTQPGAINYDTDRVSGGTPANKFDEYLIEKDKKRIDERLAEIKSLVLDRENLLRMKEAELRASTDIHDRVFCLRVIEHRRIYKIASVTHYSEAQIYRIMRDINETRVKMIGNARNKPLQ